MEIIDTSKPTTSAIKLPEEVFTQEDAIKAAIDSLKKGQAAAYNRGEGAALAEVAKQWRKLMPLLPKAIVPEDERPSTNEELIKSVLESRSKFL